MLPPAVSMEKADLIVEVGTEEIPASMLESAARGFMDLLAAQLKTERLDFEGSTVWYTPRRIIVALSGIPTAQEDLIETVTGPPARVAFDADGSPTRAAVAFAEKHGVRSSKLRLVRTPKGEYVSATRKLKGQKSMKVLARILPEAISKIHFPKTMYWTAEKFRFARPIRWILAIYNHRTLRFHAAGVASSNRTEGHRFIGRRRLVASSLASLQRVLRENGVIADPRERLKIITDGLASRAREEGGVLLEDRELLETVVNLNEKPDVICGSFDSRFLRLPEEILITVMREHQKYFSLLDGEGRLLPRFLAVINLDSSRNLHIREGHERVLHARLADAAFFWDTDRRIPLADREESLKHVLFQETLGTYFDKTRRVLGLLPDLTAMTGHSDLLHELETACHMFKCDLVTEMVKEFTDLQGIVGGLYAKDEGYSQNVSQAIYEHYLPRSTTSSPPASLTGALLSIADRIDTVTGCFSVGLVPSGSGDPFALRRQGNGLLKIILDHRLKVSMDRLTNLSLENLGISSSDVSVELKRFFESRLRFLLEEEGYTYDCINAGLAIGCDDPLDAMERIRAVHQIRDSPDFLGLASNFKRVKNILAQAGEVAGELDPSLMRDAAEQKLWASYRQVSPEVEVARTDQRYLHALRAMASMRQSVDRFFDEVLVMSEDAALRSNRLSLLGRIARMFLTVADISEIVVERSSETLGTGA